MNRIMVVVAIVLGLSLVGVRDLRAQRSGFIIGFGIGAGVTSVSYSAVFEDETKVGLATDFKIGAQVSQSFQIYYLGRTNWLTASDSDLVAAGISALGVTYVLPSAPVQLSAGIGLANWLPICLDCLGGGAGFGLTGGVGWEFADLWLLDFAVTYGSPNTSIGNLDMFLARVGISILSHFRASSGAGGVGGVVSAVERRLEPIPVPGLVRFIPHVGQLYRTVWI